MKKKTYKVNAQQEKFFKSAGFAIVKDSSNPDVRWGHEFDLVYWKRGDIVIAMTASEKITLEKFTNLLIGQVYYRTCKHIRNHAFDSIRGDEIQFPIKN
jgi:hypothetical protein